MNQFTVSPDFKARVADILGKKKFTQVFPFMNLINREGFTYNEQELNQLIQFIGEYPYNEVAELFTLMPTLVKEVTVTPTVTITKEDQDNHAAKSESSETTK